MLEKQTCATKNMVHNRVEGGSFSVLQQAKRLQVFSSQNETEKIRKETISTVK